MIALSLLFHLPPILAEALPVGLFDALAPTTCVEQPSWAKQSSAGKASHLKMREPRYKSILQLATDGIYAGDARALLQEAGN